MKKVILLFLIFLGLVITLSSNEQTDNSSFLEQKVDQTNKSYTILNQPGVLNTGQLYGIVIDAIKEDVLAGVTVTAGSFITQTNGLGYYNLIVDNGTYDLGFGKPGFESEIVSNVIVTTGSSIEQNADLFVCCNPVNWVWADVNLAETQCIISWFPPLAPSEWKYDDDEIDDFVLWAIPGNAVGVRFGLGLMDTITGGRLNVGDGSFPTGANFLGTQMAVGIVEDDGVNGLPGTVIDSILVNVDNYEWVYFEFDSIVVDNEYYIVMWQLGNASNSAPIAIDTDNQINESVIFQQAIGWSFESDRNFMIRANIYGPTDFYISNYILARITDFDPDMGPETGVLTPIANPTTLYYNDLLYGILDTGYYAYAVKVEYPHCESSYTYSNIVSRGLENQLIVEVDFCSGLPEGVEVTVTGNDYPYYNFFDVSDTSGILVFDSVIDGLYNLYAYKPGYEPYEHLNLEIIDNMHYNIVLEEIQYPAQNLIVDSLTSLITWDEPTIYKLPNVDFEDAVFPPDGWQSTSLGVGWYRTDDGGTGSWVIPPGDGFYALSNDNVGGASNDGSNDYLITPELDLTDCVSYQMKFDYFFDGANDQNAYVEYSIDAGATWEVIQSMEPVTEWTEIFVDLTFLAGPNSQPVLLAFHADDNGSSASGWAVDNIEISNFPMYLLGYYIYLNDSFITQLPYAIESYTFVDLEYGQSYYAGVRALYSCGLSDEIGAFWESAYLHPPRNLTDNYVYGTNTVPLMWNPPMTGTIPMGAAFNVVYVGPQKQKTSPTMDAADEVTIIEFEDESNRSRAILQFSFPDLMGGGEAGCETDGEFIYTVRPDMFVKYDLDGFLIETFTIPGVSDVKDLAYDGEFFYGAAANTTVFVMDFNTQSLITTFVAPTDVRAIAYNEDDNTFYANNWGTDIVNFDASGNSLGSFTPSVSAIYGLAFDKWSIQAINCLWAYDQGENNLIQFALPGGEPTGSVIDVECQTCTTGLAGGLFTYPGLYEEGKVTIGGNVQDEEVWGIELADYNTTGGLIPEGLVSFNIYQNFVCIANVPYENQAPDEWTMYFFILLILDHTTFV